jgi:predicted amidohydrolase
MSTPILALLGFAALAASLFTADTPAPDAWQQWAPRQEISPRFSRDGDTLRIECTTRADYGVWRRRFEMTPGKSYRVTAFYKTRGVEDPALCASARIYWRRADGQWARPPDYLPAVGGEDGWTRLEDTMTAPEGTASGTVDLAFGWAAKGSVSFGRVSVTEATPAAPRPVRVATIFQRPRNSTPDANMELFCRLAEGAADRKPDIILFPEGMLMCGTSKSYPQSAEPIPGPATERLGTLARKMNAYVVAGLMERVGTVVYNSAVLIDRQGKPAGTYRKTHLPREEVEGGVTPGDTYPVFKTDFGKVGLAICWDTQFPEPIRAMALQGADLILVPIWGGSDVICRARAMENHVYLATSSYDMATFIVDPEGKVLSQASAKEPVAVAEVDLNRKIIQPWLGDMKVRTWRERRADIPLPRTFDSRK